MGKTDSRILQRAITSAMGVSNRKLRIDIAAVKEMIERGEIARLQWTGSKQQVADGLTKAGGSV